MFGIGGSEIVVILIVALLFLGPEKLPDAAKTISKGIRDLRRSTRDLQSTIENDTQLGGAIRDIKSALRGEEPRPQRPPVRTPPPTPPPKAEVPAEPLVGPPPPPELEPPQPDDATLAQQLIRPAAGTVSKGNKVDEEPQGS